MKNEQAYYSQKSSIYHQPHKKSRILSNSALTVKTKLNYIKSALAKSKASRQKLNIYKANSTPIFTRAFFVRSVYAPIQNNLSFDRLFPMVERNRKGFALCRFPCMTVSDPVTFYRPIVRSLAVVPEKFIQGLSTMLFKFLLLGDKRLRLFIYAKTEAEARQRLNLTPENALFIARIKGACYA
ncbi:ash family protein [Rodentibacter caecimuris]|uniref:ash family protein n=1 Tax=Rodentibacter caecimuris TaxID=1796644 RepID=UPI0013A08A41|nr:ash family protein [Rodentibacter heylii]QIA77706.1 host cell division inhibitor Icd-like protein [Rodentibacter heylii]